jgi:hypothetical protein
LTILSKIGGLVNVILLVMGFGAKLANADIQLMNHIKYLYFLNEKLNEETAGKPLEGMNIIKGFSFFDKVRAVFNHLFRKPGAS